VLREVIIIPNTSRKIPSDKTGKKYPASNARPQRTPTKRSKKPWIEPIHEMAEGVDSGKSVAV
jgi:hypothetical protein